MHPAFLAILVLASVMILTLPRRYVIAPFLMVALPFPLGQMLLVGPFHFQTYRILVVVGGLRLLIQRFGTEGAPSKIKWNAIDSAVFWYSIVSVVATAILWNAGEPFISQLGMTYSAMGLYFIFRFFIRDQEDIEIAIKSLVCISAVIALCMINEQLTGRNILAIFGGVPAFTAVRDGYLRSQGPFEVYLTAGSFGATLAPIFLLLWRKDGSKFLAAVGLVAAVAITVTSRTSTALSAFAAGVLAIGMWRIRDHMRTVRWLILTGLVAAHLYMKAPVWALIAKIDLVGSSSGWHRFKIIDNCVTHFRDWWFVGARDYRFWEGGDDMWDQANQYVAIAENTGLLATIFFMAILVYSFKYLGAARKASEGDTPRMWMLWLMGSALFSTMMAFLGISYFDQTQVYWYLLLAFFVAAARPHGVMPGTAPAPVTAAESQVWSGLLATPSRFSLNEER